MESVQSSAEPVLGSSVGIPERIHGPYVMWHMGIPMALQLLDLVHHHIGTGISSLRGCALRSQFSKCPSPCRNKELRNSEHIQSCSALSSCTHKVLQPPAARAGEAIGAAVPIRSGQLAWQAKQFCAQHLRVCPTGFVSF